MTDPVPHVYELSRALPYIAEAVYEYHARPGALQRLIPPWELASVGVATGGIERGAKVVINLRTPIGTVSWRGEHTAHEHGRMFRDRQTQGPFAFWEHTHWFEHRGDNASVLRDHVEYRLPLEPVSSLLAGSFVRRKLDEMFRYRHAVVAADLDAHARHRAACRGLRVGITGSSGAIGSALCAFLSVGGLRVIRLLRRARPMSPGEPGERRLLEDPESLEGLDAVINLAGEPLLGGKWDDAKRRRIRESRIDFTRSLVDRIAGLAVPPRLLISASATGFYGSSGNDVLDEASQRGSGFLADLCESWESEATWAARLGIRVVIARFGVVLTPRSGALAAMLPQWKSFIGGTIGRREDWIPWISLDDALDAILHVIADDKLDGPVNLTAPHPVRQDEFASTLARVLQRPGLIPKPPWLVRSIMGPLADETVLTSCRAAPQRLVDIGHRFRFPTLEGALRHTLGRRCGRP